MKIIGLTGSIGMGKSAAAKMLRVMRFPVFDSDACVHSLLATGGAGVGPVLNRFPEAKDSSRRGIDRKKLGEIVFRDPAARKALEAILHPLVWSAQRQFIAKSRRAGYRKIILDIPLLFETGSHRKCDAILCVSAPHFIQRQRVLSRTGMTEDKFMAILMGQLGDHHKRKLSDYIIPTGIGRAFTLQRLKKTLRLISKQEGKPL